jgi:protease IV
LQLINLKKLMNFFKSFLASCLGAVVAFFVLVVLFVVILVAASGDKEVVIKDSSVLHLQLDKPITEMEVENPLEGLPIPGAEESAIGLIQLKKVIKAAAEDAKIKGIYLDLSGFMGGFAAAKEVRESLLDFKKSGKWVVAYNEVMSEKAYYIISAADKVYLNPEGQMEFNGMAVETPFFKKMFDKLEIKPEIFRVGDFKSAVEPFFLDKMSDANRLQINELIKGINDEVIAEVAQSRNIELSRLKEISNHMLATTTQEAYALKLVDSLVYFDQVLADLQGRLGLKDSKDINFIKYNKYKKTVNTYGSSDNEVAVIVANGDIMPGKGDNETIGSDTFAKELRRARTSKKVKAIVLRINSPGGSALASDVMWREVVLASKEKPIIASMGDYAASGGYYIAMGCDTIVAQPNTITGSIGVFSVLFDLSSFLDNKIGITFDEVKTGDMGDMVTVTRPLTAPEKAIWQKSTDRIYESFTTKAAEGRNMPVEKLRSVASGRVWTGAQAKERGLVDMLGSFDDAIRIAAEKAGVEKNYKVKYYPQYKSFFEQWRADMEENAKTKMLKAEWGAQYKVYEQVMKLKRYQGAQARMPFEVELN